MRWKISYNPSSMQEYLDEILQYCVANASKALQNDKERVWTSCSSEYDKLAKQLGNDEEMVKAFSLIINEILLLQMHTFFVAMDGGEWISEKYRFDIVDKGDESIINENTALHEEFFDYLWEKRNGDPFEKLQ